MKIGFIRASIDEKHRARLGGASRPAGALPCPGQGVMTFIYGEKGRSICGIATRQTSPGQESSPGQQSRARASEQMAGIDIWSGYVAVGPRRIKVVAAGSPKDFWDTAWEISRALPRWKQTLMSLTAAWWRLTWRLRT